MKKNYFKIMAAAMLMGMSFGLQSCDDVVGESDNPSGSTEEEVVLPAGVTITANGATFGISKLSDITDYLEGIRQSFWKYGRRGGIACWCHNYGQWCHFRHQ